MYSVSYIGHYLISFSFISEFTVGDRCAVELFISEFTVGDRCAVELFITGELEETLCEACATTTREFKEQTDDKVELMRKFRIHIIFIHKAFIRKGLGKSEQIKLILFISKFEIFCILKYS